RIRPPPPPGRRSGSSIGPRSRLGSSASLDRRSAAGAHPPPRSAPSSGSGSFVGPLEVNLLDTTEVLSVDQDRVRLNVADPLFVEHDHAAGHGEEHVARPVEQALRFRAGVQVDRTAHQKWWYLEHDPVAQLVNPVGRLLVIPEVRQVTLTR